ITARLCSGRDQHIAKCRKEGIKMGRPATYRKSDEAMKEQYKKEISLLKQGMSLRNINAITKTSIATIRKLYKYV
ncbi:MAG: DNA resolvase, partial [Alistipes sp.]|nr:DNA resolvase [Alistipes sp.]